MFIPKEAPKPIQTEQPPKRRRTYVPKPKKQIIVESEVEERPLTPIDLGPNMLPTAQMVLQQRQKELTKTVAEGTGPCPICWEIIRDKQERIRHIFAHDNALSILQLYYAEKDPSLLMQRENEKFEEMLEQMIILKCKDEDEEDDEEMYDEEYEEEKEYYDENGTENENEQPQRYRRPIVRFRRPRIRRLPLNFLKKAMIPCTRPDLSDVYPNYSISERERRKIENYKKREIFNEAQIDFKNDLPLCPFCLKSSKTLKLETIPEFIRHGKFFYMEIIY